MRKLEPGVWRWGKETSRVGHSVNIVGQTVGQTINMGASSRGGLPPLDDAPIVLPLDDAPIVLPLDDAPIVLRGGITQAECPPLKRSTSKCSGFEVLRQRHGTEVYGFRWSTQADRDGFQVLRQIGMAFKYSGR